MAHLVESMFYAGAVPWRGLGTPVEMALRAEEAIQVAGLDWHVKKMPIVAGLDERETEDRIVSVCDYDDSAYITVRMDSPLDLEGPKILGMVGADYEVIQNSDAFSFMDSIAGALKYETAGSLKGGRQIWLLASLRDTSNIIVGRNQGVSDEIKPYLLLTNTHDGSSSLRALLTTVRVACANTLGEALLGGRGEGITIRHTLSANARLKAATTTLGLTRKRIESFQEKADMYLQTTIKGVEWAAVVNLLFPPSKEGLAPRTLTSRLNLMGLMDTGVGIEGTALRGTLWGAMNAVTQYSSHESEVRGDNKAENRLNSVWFGRATDFNRKAVQYLDMIVADKGSDVINLARNQVKELEEVG